MYELFVLGELMDQPLHGYLLHTILSRALGPLRQISWGSLYPLIKRLTQEGLITQLEEEQPEAVGRKRKVYQISELGIARFFELMREPLNYTADSQNLFRIKLSNFGHISLEMQLAILNEYKEYAEFMINHALMSKKQIVAEPEISENERQYILLTNDHKLTLAEADLEWISQQIHSLGEQKSEKSLKEK